MFGATLVILSLIALAWYVAKVGTVFTLVFVGAVLFMAYKRMPLIVFTLVFTVLLLGYTFVPPAQGVWKGFLWLMLAALWLLTIRPLRKALRHCFSSAFMDRVWKCKPEDIADYCYALKPGIVPGSGK